MGNQEQDQSQSWTQSWASPKSLCTHCHSPNPSCIWSVMVSVLVAMLSQAGVAVERLRWSRQQPVPCTPLKLLTAELHHPGRDGGSEQAVWAFTARVCTSTALLACIAASVCLVRLCSMLCYQDACKSPPSPSPPPLASLSSPPSHPASACSIKGNPSTASPSL